MLGSPELSRSELLKTGPTELPVLSVDDAEERVSIPAARRAGASGIKRGRRDDKDNRVGKRMRHCSCAGEVNESEAVPLPLIMRSLAVIGMAVRKAIDSPEELCDDLSKQLNN